MKKALPITLALSLFVLGNLHAVEKKTQSFEKFYGKLTAVNVNLGSMVVYNKKKKMESSFSLNKQTAVIQKKKLLPQSKLEVGQNLIVYFTHDDDKKVAKRVTIRSPYQRKKKTIEN